mmetsp:Transcript_57943/g.124476  ORF Transcript_57943/g.124476 Transcript_57943/m.124476 type:complete len:300 (-) Transcript_57943:1338-2237(-)
MERQETRRNPHSPAMLGARRAPLPNILYIPRPDVELVDEPQVVLIGDLQLVRQHTSALGPALQLHSATQVAAEPGVQHEAFRCSLPEATLAQGKDERVHLVQIEVGEEAGAISELSPATTQPSGVHLVIGPAEAFENVQQGSVPHVAVGGSLLQRCTPALRQAGRTNSRQEAIGAQVASLRALCIDDLCEQSPRLGHLRILRSYDATIHKGLDGVLLVYDLPFRVNELVGDHDEIESDAPLHNGPQCVVDDIGHDRPGQGRRHKFVDIPADDIPIDPFGKSLRGHGIDLFHLLVLKLSQ